jgi:PAS domain S-box-containing protein
MIGFLRGMNARLIILVSATLLVSGAISGWVTARKQSDVLVASMRDNSWVMVRNFAASSAHYLLIHDYAGLESFLLKSAELPDVRSLQVCEPNGVVIGDIERKAGAPPLAKPGLARIYPPSRSPTILDEDGHLIIWQSIEAGSMLGWIKATYIMAHIRKAQIETLKSSLLLALVWAAGSAIMLLLVLRPIVRTFGRLTEFAMHLDEHKGARIAVGLRIGEIVDLAASLNHASDRLLSTEQQLVEDRERLRESEAMYRSLVAAMAEGVVFQAADGSITAVNPAAERIEGRTEVQMLGRSSMDPQWGVIYEDGTPFPGELHPAMVTLRTGEPQSNVVMGIHKPDGMLAWISVNSQPLVSGERTKPYAVVTTFHDITDRKRAEDEVRHLKNYLANIIESMPSMLVGLDRDGNVTQWNRQAEAATGISASAAIGKSVAHVLPDYAPWIEAMHGEIGHGHPAIMEKLLLERRGERCFYDLMLYPLIANGVEGTVVRIEDVTERARIQEMMIQTEKMMSVGGLAAGMAHEINNPLGIITQAVQNIERRVSPDLPANREAAAESGVNLDGLTTYFERRQIPEFIASIREAASRASRIIANMLRFSRRAETTMLPASLADVMEQAVELAANDYDLKKKYDFRSIEILRDVAPDLPDVPVLATEIEQVLLNLLKNSAQAMIANPAERKPRIVLRLKQEERYAVLEVEDNGPGMPEDIRRRVFEPFFTTKEPGIGTGLGLSVSYMIVTQNHKGLMEVVSTPGNGACFTVRLPLYRENNHG